jgi:N-acetylneuraminate synthase
MLASEVDKSDLQPYQALKDIFEKSLVAAADLPAGAVLTRELVGIKKPGTGISAARLAEFLGRRLRRAVESGQILSEEDFS